MPVDEFQKFCTKNALVASSLAFVVGVQLRTVVTTLIDTVIDPLLSADLNSDGVPDMEQLKMWVVHIGNYKFSVGRLIADVIKSVMTVGVVYAIVHAVVRYTNLLDNQGGAVV